MKDDQEYGFPDAVAEDDGEEEKSWCVPGKVTMNVTFIVNAVDQESAAVKVHQRDYEDYEIDEWTSWEVSDDPYLNE